MDKKTFDTNKLTEKKLFQSKIVRDFITEIDKNLNISKTKMVIEKPYYEFLEFHLNNYYNRIGWNKVVLNPAIITGPIRPCVTIELK